MSSLFYSNMSRLQHLLFDDFSSNLDGTSSAKDLITNFTKSKSVNKRKQNKSLTMEKDNFVIAFHKYAFNINLVMEVFNTTSSKVEIEMKTLELTKIMWTKDIHYNLIFFKKSFCLGAPKRDASPLLIAWSWQRNFRILKCQRETCFYWRWCLESRGMPSKYIIVSCRFNTRPFPRFHGEYWKSSKHFLRLVASVHFYVFIW